jgi:leader peptidase (prepilin peptidase)/N-methyltransferase
MPTTHELHLVAAVPAAVVGLTIGSFAGVLVDRVPHGHSIVRPPSHCDSCGTPLRPVDNIPVVSFLLLRGRCRSCGARIPRRDLVIELVTALLFAAVTIRVASFAALPAYLVLVVALVALSAIDIQLRRLPSSIIYVAGAIGALLLVVASAATSNWTAMLHALIGAGACFGVFFLIWFAVPRGMGFGDVRLAGLCGLFLGWLGLVVIPFGIFAAFVVAGIPATVLIVLGKVTRKSSMPFGPYLAAGTVIGVLFGPAISHAISG